MEVCSNGGWGTVCDIHWERSWDFRDAIVVCRELGHSTIGIHSLILLAFREEYTFGSIRCSSI